MARLGGRPPRRCPAEHLAGAGGEERRQQQAAAIGERVMAWWRARVVAPVRRAWLAVARVRKGECAMLSLHQDVQTCGYNDVQVMWDMLSSDKAAAAAAVQTKHHRIFKRPFCWPPATARSPCAAAAQ